MLTREQMIEGKLIVTDAIQCQHELDFGVPCEVPLVLYADVDEFVAMSIDIRDCLRIWTANSRGVRCVGLSTSAH